MNIKSSLIVKLSSIKLYKNKTILKSYSTDLFQMNVIQIIDRLDGFDKPAFRRVHVECEDG